MAVKEDVLKKPNSLGSTQLSNYATALNAVRNKVASAPSAPTAQPISRTNQTLDSLAGLSNASPFQFQGPEAFAYNQNEDPAYKAALESARQNITQQQADTNARLRAGGQGKSSYSESVANQIGAKEMARVSTDVLPQLISQAYQRYADQANRDLQVQQANYGTQQDQISNLARLYAMQNQQDFENPMAEAQLTGSYLPGEARQYIDAINNLKQQAEMQGVTSDQMDNYRRQADAYRDALQGLGIDSSLFSADVNRATSLQNLSRAGLQTMAMQQQNYAQQADQRNFDRGVLESDRSFDFQKAQQEWDNNFRQGQFDWQKAQQTWENAFQEKNFQQQMKEAAASRGLQWASLNQRQKEFVADQAFREKQFAFEQEKYRGGSDGGTGLSQQDLSNEASAMLGALRSGQLSPNAALAQIDDDERVGVYTSQNAAYLRSLLTSAAPTAPSIPTATQKVQAEYDKSLPSDKQIDDEAKRLGYPTIDYRSWYKSPNGRSTGTDFETWNRLYGPRLVAK